MRGLKHTFEIYKNTITLFEEKRNGNKFKFFVDEDDLGKVLESRTQIPQAGLSLKDPICTEIHTAAATRI